MHSQPKNPAEFKNRFFNVAELQKIHVEQPSSHFFMDPDAGESLKLADKLACNILEFLKKQQRLRRQKKTKKKQECKAATDVTCPPSINAHRLAGKENSQAQVNYN